jgi:hypothetical protein
MRGSVCLRFLGFLVELRGERFVIRGRLRGGDLRGEILGGLNYRGT